MCSTTVFVLWDLWCEVNRWFYILVFIWLSDMLILLGLSVLVYCFCSLVFLFSLFSVCFSPVASVFPSFRSLRFYLRLLRFSVRFFLVSFFFLCSLVSPCILSPLSSVFAPCPLLRSRSLFVFFFLSPLCLFLRVSVCFVLGLMLSPVLSIPCSLWYSFVCSPPVFPLVSLLLSLSVSLSLLCVLPLLVHLLCSYL